MTEARRGTAARIGISLLNLIVPGAGLLRLGRWRDALFVYGIAVAAFLVFVAVLATTEDISFRTYAVLVAFLLAASLAAYILAFWWTWRRSRFLVAPRPVWSRWYAIVGAILVAFGISWILTGVSRSLYHNFYVPSEAMEPTLAKNDRFVASMRAPKDLRRGDILLVKTSAGTIYVKRLAALPGDRIALRDGTVFVNGAAARAITHGFRQVLYPYIEATRAQVYLEQFPGEARPHVIQDLGLSQEDNFPEETVAESHVFLLGDNRDDSADSRISKEMGGLEQVPVGDIVGRPLFFYWPKAKMGHSLRNSGQ